MTNCYIKDKLIIEGDWLKGNDGAVGQAYNYKYKDAMHILFFDKNEYPESSRDLSEWLAENDKAKVINKPIKKWWQQFF